MESTSFLLVIASAFSHATWNVLAKKGEDKEAYMWIMVTTSLFTLIPVYLIILPDWSFPFAALPYMLVSAVAETLYFITLGKAYELGDLSVVYPLARSSPLFLTILAVLFLNENVSFWGALGISLIVIGVYTIHLKSFDLKGITFPLRSLRERAPQYALLTALWATIYSLTDKVGVTAVNPVARAPSGKSSDLNLCFLSMNENAMEMGAGGIRLGGIVDTSTIDWYGNVSLVVFFAGCNFRCPYCQNSGLIPLDSGKMVDPEYLEKRLRDEKNLLDAVVLSGGEPLLQPEGIRVACQLAKEMGFKVMLNTNGSRPRVIEGLLNDGSIDRVAFDVKAPLNPSSYASFTGTEMGDTPTLIRRSLDICKEHGIEIEARTTVAPGLSDESWFIRAIAEDIRDLCGMYVLQQFDNMGEVLSQDLKSKTPPTKEKLIDLAGVASDEGLKSVYIKTRRTGLERVR